jgi:hypothetical protein
MSAIEQRQAELTKATADHDWRTCQGPWRDHHAIVAAYGRVLAARHALNPQTLASDLGGAAHELEFYRPYDDIGQPCGGYACDGHNAVCDDCGQAIDDYHQTLRSEMYR